MESKEAEAKPDTRASNVMALSLARHRLDLIKAASEMIEKAASAPGNLLGEPGSEWADGRASGSIECALAAIRFAHANCELEVQARELDDRIIDGKKLSFAIRHSHFKENAGLEIIAVVAKCLPIGPAAKAEPKAEREPDTDRAAEDHAEGGA